MGAYAVQGMRQRKMNFIYVFLLDNQSDWLEISLSHRMNRLFRKHNFDIEMLHSRDGARSANLGRPVVRRCLLSCQKWGGGMLPPSLHSILKRLTEKSLLCKRLRCHEQSTCPSVLRCSAHISSTSSANCCPRLSR